MRCVCNSGVRRYSRNESLGHKKVGLVCNAMFVAFRVCDVLAHSAIDCDDKSKTVDNPIAEMYMGVPELLGRLFGNLCSVLVLGPMRPRIVAGLL